MSELQQPRLMLEAQGLSKHYKRRGSEPLVAVKHVDLDIHQGEILSLLGPNGAGKTTTISMMCGLLTPTSGDVKIGGFSVNKQPLQAKALLGVVPQEIALYDALTARQNLDFFGKMQGKRGAELSRLIDNVLDIIDLRDRQNEKITTFSGGMKRRVNIAAGLLHQPQLLFMDEPTVGIDPQNRRRILDLVERLRSEYRMTILYTSHLMEEVQELSDRVAIMDHGEIIALGTVRELLDQLDQEDRIVLRVGQQQIAPEILSALQQAVDLVRSASFEQPDAEAASGQNGQIVVMARSGQRALPLVLQQLNEAGVEIQAIEVREPDLETVFLHLTGRALRD